MGTLNSRGSVYLRLLLLGACGLALLAPGRMASAQESGGEALFGTLQFEGEPVEGVRVDVLDFEGTGLGTSESDAEGMWRVELPGPGTYQVILDGGSLPEGVNLQDEGGETLEIEVQRGRARPVIFRLGERTGSSPSLGEEIAQASLNGLKLGLIVAMCAVGLSLIFGTTGLINFAHGELVTFGAFIAWWFNAESLGLQLILAAGLAIITAGALGGVLETGMFRPLRARRLGSFQFVVVTIGLSLLGRHLFLLFFGPDPERYVDFTLQSNWDIGWFSVTPRDFTIMVLSAVILVGVAVFLQRTRMGKAMRAVSDNFDLAESSGIDVNRVILFVWIAGAMLAATGGIFLGSVESVDWFMGFRLLLLMFAAVVLGGLGTAYGAMVGAIVIGLVTELSTVWFNPEIKTVFALLALIIALLIRPQGLLGRKERVG